MQRYQSHKIVEAARVEKFEVLDEGDYRLVVQGYPEVVGATREVGTRILEAATASGHEVIGGYLVIYDAGTPDEWVSWSPARQFADGYDLVQPSSGKSKIAGYRELNETELELMNRVKQLGHSLEAAIHDVRKHTADDQDIAPGSMPDSVLIAEEVERQDAYRWISIAQTHLQQGLMALTRAVAKPEFF